MSATLLASLSHYVPECLAIITMIALLYFESVYGDREKGRLMVFISGTIGLVATAGMLIVGFKFKATPIFYNAIVIDPFSTFLKLLMVLGTLANLWLAFFSKDIYQNFKSEFCIMTIGTMVGGMLLVSSNNMINLYLGIETLSILSYVLATLKKYDARANESGLKYVLYGGIASGIMLFGMSHIYGMTGTIEFNGIAEALRGVNSDQTMVLVPAFLMMLAGVGYKISAFPFHMWTPDVYEGAPMPVTSFFSIVPKLAGIGALIRITMTIFAAEGVFKESWILTLQLMAALTMTVGNVSAIGQRSVKRMLAFSSISHAGVLILGVCVANEIGVRAVLFYGVTYLFMTLVAFFITSFISDEYGNDHFERFNGLIYRHPIMAIAMAITMFSLAGLPPLSGFVAKFNIINAVVAKGYYTLAVIAVINSVVSLYYYMKLVKLMIIKEADDESSLGSFNFLNQFVIGALTVPVVVLGIFWDSILSASSAAKIFLNQ